MTLEETVNRLANNPQKYIGYIRALRKRLQTDRMSSTGLGINLANNSQKYIGYIRALRKRLLTDIRLSEEIPSDAF